MDHSSRINLWSDRTHKEDVKLFMSVDLHDFYYVWITIYYLFFNKKMLQNLLELPCYCCNNVSLSDPISLLSLVSFYRLYVQWSLLLCYECDCNCFYFLVFGNIMTLILKIQGYTYIWFCFSFSFSWTYAWIMSHAIDGISFYLLYPLCKANLIKFLM